MKSLFLWICLCTASIYGEEYAFEGRHFLASYCQCDPNALINISELEQVMHRAAEASGATILGSSAHYFSPDGLTLVILLSESHASIHTYPEHASCFVDLFTCGSRCCEKNFDQVLRQYLQPKEVDARLFIRNQGIYDFSKSQ